MRLKDHRSNKLYPTTMMIPAMTAKGIFPNNDPQNDNIKRIKIPHIMPDNRVRPPDLKFAIDRGIEPAPGSAPKIEQATTAPRARVKGALGPLIWIGVPPNRADTKQHSTAL